MKKKNWIRKTLCGIFCLALLPGCGEQPLQKPVADVFAQATEQAAHTPVESPAETEAPLDIPTETQASAQNTDSPSPSQIIETTASAPRQITEPSDSGREQADEPAEPVDLPVYTHPPIISADDLDTTGLPNMKLGWYFMKNSENLPTRGASEIDISVYNGYYLGDVTQKYIWLTFDNGYENGYTALILDTLSEKNVQAAFFVTGTYIRDNPDLTKRIADEGHLVANHSITHPSMPDISDQMILDEIYGTANRFKELTGLDMPAFIRPPSGEYSERVLYILKEAGYKTIFWSFTYTDWLVDNQPGKDYAYNIVMDNLHNGEILLLHSVSSSNAEALPDIIDAVKAQGYEFKSLYDL